MSKHKWKEVELPNTDKTKHICTRGTCKCIKWTSKYGVVYERARVTYSKEPICLGDSAFK